MTTASAIHANTAADHPGTTVTTTKVATGRTSSRRKVKDFNDSLTCSLCSGYLIEATTVNDCLHSFCRSCIVRHLESHKYCPKCKSYNNKTITVVNLRPDRILRSLVYKLIPGLHQAENQRASKFYADQCGSSTGPDEATSGSRKPPDHIYLDDQNFFSPDELIDLSLEYHYDSIANYDPKQQQLPITFLRCPAAVTIHHLYKLILSKNGLRPDNERIQVDIIYEDEILPHEFTLMDVAYCFDYKRCSLMRLYYRIFIHPNAKPTATTTTYNVGSDKNSNENNNNGGGERDANNSTTGSSTDANLSEPSQGSAESSSSSSPSSSKPTSTSPSKNATGASCAGEAKAPTNSPAISLTEPKEAETQIKADTQQDAVKSVNNESSHQVSTENSVKSRFQASEASCYSKYDSKLIITKTNKSDKSGSEKKEKESLKLVLVPKKSDKNDAKIVYSKSDSKASKSPKQSSPNASVSSGDFKRLRSNDIRYSEYETTSSSTSSSKTTNSKNGSVPGDDSKKSESHHAKKHNKINNDYNNPSDSSGKKFFENNSRNKVSGNEATGIAGCETAPAQPACVAKTKHEKSKSSPVRSESNGALVAITDSSTTHSTTVAEKNEKSSELKCYVNLKKQMVVSPLTSSTDHQRKEVPKLKIELPSLKTKITIPKPDNEKSPKSVHSSSTSSSAATSPTASSSASGKSPVWPKPDDSGKSGDGPNIGIEEYAKTIGLKPVHKISEGDCQRKKKKSSTSSSPDPFFHRKRKKAKHSKEPGGKRRKLHAEISSQHDESLKMKVKLTEKPSKHDRKPSEEITPHSPKEPTKHNAEVTPSSSFPPPPVPLSTAPSISVVSTPVSTTPKEDNSKVIDITKGDDDDDVKIIEHPTFEAWLRPVAAASVNVIEKPTSTATRVNELPNLPSLIGSDSSTKAKINEMRAIRHKPMVYIPNPDKNLLDNSPTINNLIQSVQAKTGFIEDNDVQIVSAGKLEGNGPVVSNVPVPPLVPTKQITMSSSMKQPSTIPSSANSRTVSTNSIPKNQTRVAVQSHQVFSPRHTPNYPPLALQTAPKKVINPSTQCTNIYQPRNVNPAFKRSTSVDSNSVYNVPPKTPRVDLMEVNAQNRFLKKPIYAPMFNFVKGASLAKNGNPNRLPTSANDVPYKSPISSSYTKEINAKKPVPSLLLPPSSISVTKMTDTVPHPPPIDNRPALEIVRIPSTAPVADKPQPTITVSSPKASSLLPKTSRPPPPTIPLIKIKKSVSMPEQPSSPISPTVFQVTSSSTNSSSNLSTTCASHQDTSGALDLTTRANDDLIIFEGSDSLTPKLNGNEHKHKQSVEKRLETPVCKSNSESKIEIDSSRLELINSLIQTSAASMIKAGSGMIQNSIPGLKLPPEMIGFAITSSSASIVSPSSTTTATGSVKSVPMPKLAEINRNRNTAVRQLNQSVRSIPNPSALAFRNQTIAISSSSGIMPATSFSVVAASSSSGHTITSFSPTSPSTARIMNVSSKTNHANTSAGPKASVNNNSVDTISSIASLAKTNTNAFSSTTNGNGASSGAVLSLNGKNNNNNNINNNNTVSKNDNVSSTSGGGGKKTIEKVAAGLKAAAATAAVADTSAIVANGANGNRVVSSSNGSKNSVNVV